MNRSRYACLLAGVLLAIPLLGGSARAAESGGAQPGVARKLLGSGREAARLGYYGEADVALRGALAACRASAEERCVWTALTSLAAVGQTLGNLDEARGFAAEAAAVAHRMRDRSAQGESYHLLALVLAASDDAEGSRAAAQRALAVGNELSRADLQAKALVALGRLELAAGRSDEACGAFDAALEKADRSGLVPLSMRSRMGLGHCLAARGETEGAEAAFEEAFAEALSLGDELSVARLTHEMARLSAARGEPAQAEELLAEALWKYRALGASAYVESAQADLENLRARAGLPTPAERAERALEARSRGMERLEAGNMEAAVRKLKEAVALAPYDPETRRGLARAYRALGLDKLADEEESYASGLVANDTPFDLTSQNPRYRDYFTEVRRRIDRVYVVPGEVVKGEVAGAVRVTFTLERTGRLTEASVETSAGSALLDEAALTTLRLADPFEPFPDGVSQEQVTITARFVYEKDLGKEPAEASGEK